MQRKRNEIERIRHCRLTSVVVDPAFADGEIPCVEDAGEKEKDDIDGLEPGDEAVARVRHYHHENARRYDWPRPEIVHRPLEREVWKLKINILFFLITRTIFTASVFKIVLWDEKTLWILMFYKDALINNIFEKYLIGTIQFWKSIDGIHNWNTFI